MEQGPKASASSVPKYPTQDPHHRILARQRSRYTHYYFYIRDEVLGPMVMRAGSRSHVATGACAQEKLPRL